MTTDWDVMQRAAQGGGRSYRDLPAPTPVVADWDGPTGRWWRAGVDAAYASVYAAQREAQR